MKNIIEKLFGIKILNKKSYDLLVDCVADCGNIYRDHAGNDYHHGGAQAEILLTDLGRICLVENIIWDDVKHKINHDHNVAP